MTSIVELFPKCRKLAYDARQHLAQAQHGTVSVTELYMVLEELNRQLDCMDEYVLRETPAQRDVWKRKITELRQECVTLRQSGEATAAYSNRQQQQQQRNSYGNDRDELMLRRRKRRQGDESDLGNLADESQSLQQSTNMVDDLLASGQASLTGLVDQRQRLRGVKRVLVDIGSRLGLSQSTMRIIERRDITDAYLVAAGMVVTCLVIYFVWF
jgi:Golgi SNAP receptor complex protein 2